MFKWFKSLGSLKACARIYKFPSWTLFSPVPVKFATNLKILRISSVVIANLFTRKICNQPQNPTNFFSCCCKFFCMVLSKIRTCCSKIPGMVIKSNFLVHKKYRNTKYSCQQHSRLQKPKNLQQQKDTKSRKSCVLRKSSNRNVTNLLIKRACTIWFLTRV